MIKVRTNETERAAGIDSSVIILGRYSDLMMASDRVRMAELKAEYSKLSTTPKRMREINEEMKALRSKVVL